MYSSDTPCNELFWSSSKKKTMNLKDCTRDSTMCKLRKSISHQPPSVPAPLPTSTFLQHLGARILRKIKTKLLLRLRALCWFCLQNLATRALPKFNSCFTLVTYLTDFCVQESSTRGRATTSAPCAYRVVYERLLSPSAPPQIFFCERLPWKLISHSDTSQDFRNPVKDPIKDSCNILDWWNIL